MVVRIRSNINFTDIVSSEKLASKYIKEKKLVKKGNNSVVASLFVAVQYLIDPDTKIASYIFLWVFIYYFIHFFMYSKLLEKTLEKDSKMNKEYSMSIIVSDETLVLNYPNVSIEIYWSSIKDFKEDAENFYILIGTFSSYFILKKNFTDLSYEEIEYFTEKIRNKNKIGKE